MPVLPAPPHILVLLSRLIFIHWSHIVESKGSLRTLETIRYNLLARDEGEAVNGENIVESA